MNASLRKWCIALIGVLLAASAWCAPYQVAAWTFGDGASLQAAADRAAIDEVNVDWYVSQADLTLRADGVDPNFVATAHARGIKVLATVSNYNNAYGDFDPDLAAGILAVKAKRDKHINAIVRLCVENGYDGIDLDWEGMHPADKDRFSIFVRDLARRLHNKKKLLSIAVHAKSEEPGNWEGPQSQDWVKIGAVVDEFKVMTYDYSGPWSAPGPIAPPSWTDAVLAHAESLVPASKIMMGVPFYGYNWQPGSCSDVEFKQGKALITRYHSKIRRHGPSGEATFNYVDTAAVSHTVFFQDRPAIAAKLRMLLQKHPNIRGIAIWRMGGEGTVFWDEIVLKLR